MTTPEKEVSVDDMKTFELKKTSARCTGLFFRSNPIKGNPQAVSKYSDWPRDNAHVKGLIHDVKGKDWLEAKYIKQPGKTSFAETLGKDVWLPFKHEQYYLEEVKQ